jgi:hypothetical protein
MTTATIAPSDASTLCQRAAAVERAYFARLTPEHRDAILSVHDERGAPEAIREYMRAVEEGR